MTSVQMENANGETEREFWVQYLRNLLAGTIRDHMRECMHLGSSKALPPLGIHDVDQYGRRVARRGRIFNREKYTPNETRLARQELAYAFRAGSDYDSFNSLPNGLVELGWDSDSHMRVMRPYYANMCARLCVNFDVYLKRMEEW